MYNRLLSYPSNWLFWEQGSFQNLSASPLRSESELRPILWLKKKKSLSVGKGWESLLAQERDFGTVVSTLT